MAYEFIPDPNVALTIHPGETIREVMDFYNFNVKNFAKSLDITEQNLHRILAGKQKITPETAYRLEMVTKTPSSFWNALEAQYQEMLIAKQAHQEMLEEIEWLKGIPIKILEDQQLIPRVKDKAEQVKHTLQFFKVSRVKAWEEVWVKPLLAARRSSCYESSIGSVAAWVRQGEIQAECIQCAKYDKDTFKQVLARAPQYSLLEPQEFTARLQRECAEAGVAVVFVPEMPKVPWNGAVRWLTPDKAMIILSIRGKTEDKLWFSFFHESAHVLLGDGKKEFLITHQNGDDPGENAADEMAANMLLDSKHDELIKKAQSKRDICRIAESLRISPGIVAGRYRHLTGRWSYFNGLTKKLQWKR